MLLPVIAGGGEGIVDVLPRRALGLLEEDPHVTEFVGRLRLSAEMAGEPGQQFVGAPSWAHDVEDDRGERHPPGTVAPSPFVADRQRRTWGPESVRARRAVTGRPTCHAPTRMTALALTVGCEFEFDSTQDVAAVVQVAPSPQPGVRMRRESWDTDCDHHGYVDLYGNRCERFRIATGHARIAYEAQLALASPADVIDPDAAEVPVASLPDDVLSFVMPSRFCLPDELGHEAWQRFGHLAPGWGRVQAIVDFVHQHLTWVSGASNPWTTAADAYRAGQGVCRDYAHLAITFCRALNIPARYVFGYIPDIDAPPPTEPMDFAAWFEAYLDGRWHTFDARNNTPRVGRVIVGRGRDAVDVALITSFGPLTLTGFQVRAEELAPAAAS